MEIPSDTPMVLKRMPRQPVVRTPSFTRSPSWLRCMLQGLPSYQTAPMATCGLSRSSTLSPVAMSIAWLAPWLAGCVIRLEYLFNICLKFPFGFAIVSSKAMASRLLVLLLVLLALPLLAAAPAKLKEYPGRYYIIHTDLTGDELREADLRMTKMAEEYHKRNEAFAGSITRKFPIFLYREREDYLKAGGQKGTAGYYDPNTE